MVSRCEIITRVCHRLEQLIFFLLIIFDFFKFKLEGVVSHIPQIGDAGDAARDVTNTKKAFSILFNQRITRAMHLVQETQHLSLRLSEEMRDVSYLHLLIKIFQ
jgi:hypothetical protein